LTPSAGPRDTPNLEAGSLAEMPFMPERPPRPAGAHDQVDCYRGHLPDRKARWSTRLGIHPRHFGRLASAAVYVGERDGISCRMGGEEAGHYFVPLLVLPTDFCA
jgi:hypothetical protein